MAEIDGTALRCGKECGCGQHKKLAQLNGTALEIVSMNKHGMHHRVSISVYDLLRALGTVRTG